MIVKDHWRITTHAIQLEMERLAGLLQKSAQFHSRTSTPHSFRERNDVRALNPERNDVRALNPERNDVRSFNSGRDEIGHADSDRSAAHPELVRSAK